MPLLIKTILFLRHFSANTKYFLNHAKVHLQVSKPRVINYFDIRDFVPYSDSILYHFQEWEINNRLQKN